MLTAREAIAALEDAGWTQIATGDWSWVMLARDGARVARVSPWDAAYRLHAERCFARPIRHVQRVDAILPLGALGHVVVMQRLWPAHEAIAAAFCAALGLSSDSSGWSPAGEIDASAFAGEPEVDALRQHIGELASEGAAALPFWGGLDVRPGNIMQDAEGTLKLVDPVFVSGPKIIEAIERRDRAALSRLPPGALAAFLQIPPFQSGGGELRAAVAEMGFLGV